MGALTEQLYVQSTNSELRTFETCNDAQNTVQSINKQKNIQVYTNIQEDK